MLSRGGLGAAWAGQHPAAGAKTGGRGAQARAIEFAQRVTGVVAIPLVGSADSVFSAVEGCHRIPAGVTSAPIFIANVLDVRTEMEAVRLKLMRRPGERRIQFPAFSTLRNRADAVGPAI